MRNLETQSCKSVDARFCKKGRHEKKNKNKMTRMNPSCRAATFAKAAATPSGCPAICTQRGGAKLTALPGCLSKRFGAVEFGTVQRTSGRDVRGTDEPSER